MLTRPARAMTVRPSAPHPPVRPARRSLRSGPLACLLLLGAVGLSACGGNARQVLGIERPPPDEFQVVTRAPLTVPPDFALRPPAPGAAPLQSQDPRQRAQVAVFGPGTTERGAPVAVAAGAGRSTGEAALLTRAGAGSVPTDIRAQIDRETLALADADRGFVDRLIFWQSTPQPGVVVDPAAEARRLREAAATGQPLNQGNVPVIERRRRAPLQGVWPF